MGRKTERFMMAEFGRRFWVIVALMVVVIVGMVGFFRHKRWL